ncbi:hypothetical protein [Tenacibaculum finnmarkense]|uniref:Uncharacterized protein n=1 Tax=Tenacibaculum finnmarkense genomovar finnmarkense TaxID=1458503 RepID=A0AAP1RHL0_9FLAO|nr:hypothetical protein [Tenacibaculum finnmarkense]MBE7653879.1 hypothetical protein [Tenacibaculum finnmarkense genomovar finnmarkense]MBE7696182.1 hypothetical protein [Tenacibaculum finnmarkense genomovar finnmarkense]MCD8428398.1 hypothetical protein [Tenacibaculum finnmarkense genomovar finnmarkense]MCG8732170.1 hypothetical protein [Tenacibaculum finnmarkense]MCG8752743.1 hypothetical protein [Tenacibaculum finnmarkense]
MSKDDLFAKKVKSAVDRKKEVITPFQEVSSAGEVKPIEKKYNLAIREDLLDDLKMIAIKRKTTLKALILDAVIKEYFTQK